MKLLAKMFALVADKFKEKTDKQGVPYILHCIYVMQNCSLTDENSLCVALGHDLIEDIPNINAEWLSKEFNPEIAGGINVLTHLKEEYYETYIRRISVNNWGEASTGNNQLVKIKLADLTHNMMASRLKGLTKKDFDRMEKYMQAYTYLKSI